MQWFRFYDEALDDPKVQQLPPALFKHWVNLLCLANKGTPRGTLSMSTEDVAFRLRLDCIEAQRVIDHLRTLRLLDEVQGALQPHNWSVRQRKSDDVAVRVAGYRTRNDPFLKEETLPEKHVTLPEENLVTLDVTPPDTDTDTDTELGDAPARGRYPPNFEVFWQSYPRTNGAKRTAYGVWSRLTVADRESALAGIEKWRQSDHWRRGYVVFAERYMSRRLWEDDPAPPTARPSNGRMTQADHNRGGTGKVVV